MKKFLKISTAIAASLGLILAVVLGTANYFAPDSFTVTSGSSIQWLSGAFTVEGEDRGGISASVGTAYPQRLKGELMLYRLIPIKTVNVDVVDETCLIPCGTPFGIKMLTNGVVIVGIADIKTEKDTVNPANLAGLKTGDVITAINGKEVLTNSEVAGLVEKSGGAVMNFTVKRNEKTLNIGLKPVKSETDGLYKAGLWVRDSTAGIGTLTFYDPTTQCFGGLGHGICDSDTGKLMPLLNGDIVPVTINGVTKGQKGIPGELRGYFSDDNAIGILDANVAAGVYGELNFVPQGTALKVAMKQDVKAGPAKILTTINGESPRYYDVNIEKIDYRDNIQSKNMVLHVTDPELLAKTGGIVQGMSGSPIIQNNKLVGAVTHVFVNDPTRGYGIFAENMLAVSQSVASQTKLKAS